MKLSELINNLSNKLSENGDGEVYLLGDCCEHLTPRIDAEIENECVWNNEKQDTEWKIKSVKYRIDGVEW